MLFCFISILKIVNLKNPFATITRISKLSFRFRRFILLVQTKNVNSMNYGSSTSSQKNGGEWDLTWDLQWGIYTSIPTWNHSQNSLSAAEAPSLKISSLEHLSNDHEDCFNQHENSHNLYDENEHPVFSLKENQWKLRQQLEFPKGGKTFLEQILASEVRNKSKRAGLWQSQSGIRVGKLTIWVRPFAIKKLKNVHQVYYFYKNRLTSPYDKR